MIYLTGGGGHTRTSSINRPDAARQTYQAAKAQKTRSVKKPGAAQRAVINDVRLTGAENARSADGADENRPFTENAPRAEADYAFRTAAVLAFADAYNLLLEALQNDAFVSEQNSLCADVAGALCETIYATVALDGVNARRVSLYEIGVAHSPYRHTEGRLAVRGGALRDAVENRERDIAALFSGDGLPARLRAALAPIIENDADDAAFTRERAEAFLNQCDVLSGIFI